MAFWDDLVRTVTGDKREPTPKATPAPSSKSAKPTAPGAPQRQGGGAEPVNHLGEMSAWDKFVYGQNQSGQKKFAESKIPVPAPKPSAPTPAPVNSLGEMSDWDKFVYGQNQSGQDRFASDKKAAIAPTKKPAAPTEKPAAARTREGGGAFPQVGDNNLGEMSVWDKFVYGQNQSGQDRFATDRGAVAPPAPPAGKTFLDDLGAWLTSTPEGGILHADGIAGASDRAEALNEKESFIPGERPLDAGVRKTAEDVASRSFGAGTSETKELTWAEYDALTPRARAAVDANTLLVNAARLDNEAAIASNDGDTGEDYLNDVKTMFGDNGGSDIYAPATLKILQQLGISDPEGGDLDNYLNQSALLTQNDLDALNGLDLSTEYTGTDRRVKNAVSFSDSALKNLAATLANGSSVLSTKAFNANELEELDALFEGLAMRGNFDTLGDPNAVSETYGLFMQANPTLSADSISRYFEDRLNAYDYNTAAGNTPSMGRDLPAVYISPAEFRSRYYGQGG